MGKAEDSSLGYRTTDWTPVACLGNQPARATLICLELQPEQQFMYTVELQPRHAVLCPEQHPGQLSSILGKQPRQLSFFHDNILDNCHLS